MPRYYYHYSVVDGIIVTRHLGSAADMQLGSYSTSEQLTREKWIDGRPVYRKTFDINVPTTSDTTIAHGITNLSRVIKWDGSFARSGSGIAYPHMNIPSVEGVSPTYMIDLKASSTHILIPGLNRPYVGVATVTLYYIKT